MKMYFHAYDISMYENENFAPKIFMDDNSIHGIFMIIMHRTFL